jgi:RNA polymerase sigma factor (sigma-70 family)
MSSRSDRVALANNSDLLFEETLASAQPRLRIQAQRYGIPSDIVDDIVQETFIEAWRQRHKLHNTTYIYSWLNEICRYICLRWFAAHKQSNHISLVTLVNNEDEDMPTDALLADSQAIDPVQNIIHQELQHALGNALAYLPIEQRQAIELHYLTELSQRETAQQLGISISALETRLHRARRRLRVVLKRELQIETKTPITEMRDDKLAWREVRIRCHECGHYQRLGTLESLGDGRINFRLRCPNCGSERGTEGLIPLQGIRTIKPALKRVNQWISQAFAPTHPDGWHRCPWCGTFAQMLSIHLNKANETLPLLEIHCPQCNIQGFTSIEKLITYHPEILRFTEEHPQWICTSKQMVIFDRQEALKLHIMDLKSTARLTIFLHSQMLTVLATVQE